MQRKIMWIIFAIAAIIVVMPLLVGNLEKEELDEQTRSQLNVDFIELSNGFYSEKKQTALISKLKRQINYEGKKRAFLANIRGD